MGSPGVVRDSPLGDILHSMSGDGVQHIMMSDLSGEVQQRYARDDHRNVRHSIAWGISSDIFPKLTMRLSRWLLDHLATVLLGPVERIVDLCLF